MSRGQRAFYVDTTRCINCRTCETACKDAHDAPLGVRIRRVLTFEGGEFPDVYAYNVSLSCNHCGRPACVEACPNGALVKRAADGVVLHDPARCVGCLSCVRACPYGAPQPDPAAGKVRKCDMCTGLVRPGEDPVCVTACPLRAIETGDLDEIAGRAGAVPDVQGLADAALTQPSARFKVRVEARKGAPGPRSGGH